MSNNKLVNIYCHHKYINQKSKKLKNNKIKLKNKEQKMMNKRQRNKIHKRKEMKLQKFQKK